MTDPLILPLFRKSGIPRDNLEIITISARLWQRIGFFDHQHAPESAVRVNSPDFASWIEDTIQGEVFYDCHFYRDEIPRAKWVMVFTDINDAVAFKLRWF